ncbi:MAG: cyclic nucleotide-binding domain-containing protein [Desulfobacterota bacterium]|nr:cyclic nucleotide-binding domain-containing protein [Thermodesulfobacteriota bacterium]
MNKLQTSPKDEALSFLSRGDWKKALEALEKHLEQNPEDLRSRLKRAEWLERLGRKREALAEYRNVAEAYAADGFLLQAISVFKMILRLDPSQKGVNERLAQLHAEKARFTQKGPSVQALPLFSDLNEEELRSLSERVCFKTFPKGAYLFREGDPGDSLILLNRGEVEVYKKDRRGEERPIRHLREGDCFGEFGFFLDRRRHGSVKALTDCETVEVSRDHLEALLERHPRIKEILEDLFKRRVMDNLIALSPLFAPLSAPERADLLNRFQVKNVPGDTLIFQGGDPPHSLYLIKSGEVEIFTQTRYGKRAVLARLGSGQFFGEIGVLLDKPRMAFARTTRPTELLELSKRDFEDLLRRHPPLQAIAREISSKRLSRMKEVLTSGLRETTKESLV